MRTDSILEAVGDTPLVELTELSPADGASVHVKVEGGNPTGSMKDRMALAMIGEARRRGDLEPGQPAVEYTGGSTGSSLALVCTLEGHPLHIVTADCFSEEKIETMRALGAEVEVRETPDGDVYPDLLPDMEARVREIQDEEGAYWTHQMENEDQVTGYRPMGREILADAPDLTDFVMSVGTGGGAMGAASAFREADADVHVTLVDPAESPVVTKGERGSHGIEGVAVLEEPPLVDEALYEDATSVPEAQAREWTRRLAAEEGIFAGNSTGLNVAAAVEVARRRPPEADVVTVAVDTGLKYLKGSLYGDGT